MTDIDKAIKVLRDNYERAQKLEFPRYASPIAWALYKTWLYFNFGKDNEDDIRKSI